MWQRACPHRKRKGRKYMIKVIFKNLDPSELARESVIERMDAIVEKFPDLQKSRVNVTLEMQNSPFQAGPDLFFVKAHINGGRYESLRVEKSAPSLYVALAEVVEHMLELLNRFGDRTRVKERNQARKSLSRMNLRMAKT
jgi:ribosome-associated translation inhibitor RaiA